MERTEYEPIEEEIHRCSLCGNNYYSAEECAECEIKCDASGKY